MDVYRTGGVRDQMHFKARLQPVEHGGADANVFRQPADPEAANAVLAQLLNEGGAGQRRVFISVKVGSLAHHADTGGQCRSEWKAAPAVP